MCREIILKCVDETSYENYFDILNCSCAQNSVELTESLLVWFLYHLVNTADADCDSQKYNRDGDAGDNVRIDRPP